MIKIILIFMLLFGCNSDQKIIDDIDAKIKSISKIESQCLDKIDYRDGHELMNMIKIAKIRSLRAVFLIQNNCVVETIIDDLKKERSAAVYRMIR